LDDQATLACAEGKTNDEVQCADPLPTQARMQIKGENVPVHTLAGRTSPGRRGASDLCGHASNCCLL